MLRRASSLMLGSAALFHWSEAASYRASVITTAWAKSDCLLQALQEGIEEPVVGVEHGVGRDQRREALIAGALVDLPEAPGSFGGGGVHGYEALAGPRRPSAASVRPALSRSTTVERSTVWGSRYGGSLRYPPVAVARRDVAGVSVVLVAGSAGMVVGDGTAAKEVVVVLVSSRPHPVAGSNMSTKRTPVRRRSAARGARSSRKPALCVAGRL